MANDAWKTFAVGSGTGAQVQNPDGSYSDAALVESRTYYGIQNLKAAVQRATDAGALDPVRTWGRGWAYSVDMGDVCLVAVQNPPTAVGVFRRPDVAEDAAQAQTDALLSAIGEYFPEASEHVQGKSTLKTIGKVYGTVFGGIGALVGAAVVADKISKGRGLG